MQLIVGSLMFPLERQLQVKHVELNLMCPRVIWKDIIIVVSISLLFCKNGEKFSARHIYTYDRDALLLYNSIKNEKRYRLPGRILIITAPLFLRYHESNGTSALDGLH